MTTSSQATADAILADSSHSVATRTTRPDTVTPDLVERLVANIARDASAEPADTSTALAPFSLSPTATVPTCSPEEVAEAVRRARVAQTAWAARPFRERAEIALRFHDLVLDRQDEILDLIQWEIGKARFHAYQEVAQVALLARHYARMGARYLADTKHRGFMPGMTKVREVRVPKGVVGIISPWNYPFYLGAGDTVPALLAGNAVVSKADSQCPFSLLWARALFVEAGLPADAWQIVTGPGRVVGTALIDQVDHICFTGSTATGRRVGEQAGRRLIGASLELGGKNPAIVCADADLDEAATGIALGAFTNTGQMCIHLERVYVHDSVYDAFAAKLADATRAMKLGQSYDYETDVGCLASEAQLRGAESHVDDAVEKGARVLVGGRRRQDVGPLAYEPTVLEGVTSEMRVYEEETFGPVLSLYRVASDEEAIARANDSCYGLSASVWSRDVRHGEAVARRVLSGAVNVNDGAAAAAGSIEAPMGGFRDSGLGRRHGAEGIKKYTESQTIAVQRFMSLAPPSSMPLARYVAMITKQLRLLRLLGVR